MSPKEVWRGHVRELIDDILDGEFEVPLRDDEEIAITINDGTGSSGPEEPEMLSGKPEESEGEESDGPPSAADEFLKKLLEGGSPLKSAPRSPKGPVPFFDPKKMPKMPKRPLTASIDPPLPDKGFEMRLKSMFKDNAMKRMIGNKRYGNIDFKRLHRITTTGKIFERKDSLSGRDYNIMLLVDTSGSMQGGKNYLAASTMYTLIRDFQKLVNIYVTTFNTRMIPIKEYDTIMKDEDIRKKAELIVQESMTSAAGGNHDNLALEEGFKILQRQKGTKIMMIISDGQPSCNCGECGGHDLVGKTRRMAQVIERHSIPVLSVGIMTTSVRDIYKDYEIIQDPSQLYDAILKLLSKTVRRRAVK